MSYLNVYPSNKTITVGERGLTSERWEEYPRGVKRVQTSRIPTSDIDAESVMADGFTVQQRHHSGQSNVTSAASGQTACSWR